VDSDVVEQVIVVTHHHVLVDDTEGTDDIVIAQLSLWINNS
jgi:hypothetical protein